MTCGGKGKSAVTLEGGDLEGGCGASGKVLHVDLKGSFSEWICVKCHGAVPLRVVCFIVYKLNFHLKKLKAKIKNYEGTRDPI